MIFPTALTVLVSLSLVATVLGRRIAFLLPASVREPLGFYLSPILGLAGLVLIATAYAWLSPFTPHISVVLVVAVLLFGLALEKQRAILFRDWMVLCVFVIVAAIPILAPAIRFDAFNPFNDTFTYLVHGQWLQHHAFSQPAQSSGHFPAESQVVLYQRAGQRMGSSFFLGFVQSLFHLPWSYYAFLPTVSLAFTLGSLAIGAVIQQVVPVSRTVALILCTLPAFSMNGFLFGAEYGFFPQTFGLAFAAGMAGLIPALMTYILRDRPTWNALFVSMMPLAVCLSALLFAYNDMFPAVGGGLGLFTFLLCWRHWRDKRYIIGAVLILIAEVAVITNVEFIRIARDFVHTLLGAASGSVRFGWPVLWAPIQFVAQSFGMKSPFDTNVFFVDHLVSIWIFPFVLVAIVVILARILRERKWDPAIMLMLCLNAAFWLAFLKFRYATPGMTPGEVGNTFLQFKLSKWLAPYNIGLLGICIAWLFTHTRWLYRRAVQYTVFGCLTAGMLIQYIIVAQMFTLQFQDSTLQKYAPFNVLLNLRSRFADIPKDQEIYLGIPEQHQKIKEMVAYILPDHRLAGSYKDGYIRGNIPASDWDMPMDKADWMIQYKPVKTADENPLDRVGPFYIRKAPFTFYSLQSVTTAYGTENGGGNTWNWVKDSIEYRYTHTGKTTQARMRFHYLLAGKPRTLFIQVLTASGTKLASFQVPMKGGWGEFESPIVDANSQDVVVRITASGDPMRLSAGDPRHVKFMIQNFSFRSAVPGAPNDPKQP